MNTPDTPTEPKEDNCAWCGKPLDGDLIVTDNDGDRMHFDCAAEEMDHSMEGLAK